jgi:hypothetical protein
MALSRLEQLKEKFKKDEEEKNGRNKSKESYYPFWQMDFDKQCQVRFLLDANQNNPNMYYVEKKEHTLSINGEDKKFPCLTMYGEECPICSLASKFYSAAKKFPKDSEEQKENQKKGKYYYRDRRYLMQGFIKSDPLPPSTDRENQALNNIKIFQIGNELYQIIDSQMKRIIIEDSEDPFDLKTGYDFIIQKTKKRAEDKDMASYTSSTFARKPSETDLGDKTPFDLANFLPEKPALSVLENALNAHLNGIGDEDADQEQTTTSNDRRSQLTMAQRLAELRKSTETASEKNVEASTEVGEQENDLRKIDDAPAKEAPAAKAAKDEKPADETSEEDAEIERFLKQLKEKKNSKK